MSDNDYFDLQLEEQNKVFSRIYRQMVLDSYSKDEKEFTNLYPSSLTWDMCVYKFVYEQGGRKPQSHDLKSAKRMKRGETLHSEFGDILLRTPLYYGEPKYPDFLKKKVEEKKAEGRFKNPPEYYVWHPDYPVSGWVDIPLKENGGELVIGDFKTKNIKPEEWVKKYKKFPDPSEECQLYVYAVLTDKLNLFDKPVSGIRLMYYNNRCFFHESIEPEYEVYRPLEEIKVTRTINLLDECALQVGRYKRKEESSCSNKLCKEHGDLGES